MGQGYQWTRSRRVRGDEVIECDEFIACDEFIECDELTEEQAVVLHLTAVAMMATVVSSLCQVDYVWRDRCN